MPILDKPLVQAWAGRLPSDQTEALAELERAVHAALEMYSNVHRGSGHNSLVSTLLFEQARDIVLDYLGLNHDDYVVIFCTPRRAEALIAHLTPGSYRSVSSRDIGLPLGITAVSVESRALPRGVPFDSGGGTAKLVSPRWAIWEEAPHKFEAGTPAIVNAIALAKALQLVRHFGLGVFQGADGARQPRARRDRLIAAVHGGTPFLPQTDVQRRMDDFAAAVSRRIYS